ncbi:hypothetical protein GALMADRAFT_217482 [Galerina marginata CBS 339.88]|uniref:Uncharacterized protein n=1 Tax=Galerina marginata (strain CBS 339.88) TaxID=685588 RepID=A0A067S420_GALM3|nr:hypothetical protein GALMADRAFT_217482 [Galerina marginata CBS 339.88]
MFPLSLDHFVDLKVTPATHSFAHSYLALKTVMVAARCLVEAEPKTPEEALALKQAVSAAWVSLRQNLLKRYDWRGSRVCDGTILVTRSLHPSDSEKVPHYTGRLFYMDGTYYAGIHIFPVGSEGQPSYQDKADDKIAIWRNNPLSHWENRLSEWVERF